MNLRQLTLEEIQQYSVYEGNCTPESVFRWLLRETSTPTQPDDE